MMYGAASTASVASHRAVTDKATVSRTACSAARVDSSASHITAILYSSSLSAGLGGPPHVMASSVTSLNFGPLSPTDATSRLFASVHSIRPWVTICIHHYTFTTAARSSAARSGWAALDVAHAALIPGEGASECSPISAVGRSRLPRLGPLSDTGQRL